MLPVKAAAALALLWVLVWGVIRTAGNYEVTPDKIAVFIDEKPFPEIGDAAERRKRIEKIAAMVNQLDFEQRRQFREAQEAPNDGERGRNFFEDLDREEKLYFIDLTMGTAFKQMMKAFNEMDQEERRKFVERARRDLEQDGRERGRMERLEKRDEEVYQKIVEEGVRAYYQEATAETKLDLAPLMEEMQHAMRRPR